MAGIGEKEIDVVVAQTCMKLHWLRFRMLGERLQCFQEYVIVKRFVVKSEPLSIVFVRSNVVDILGKSLLDMLINVIIAGVHIQPGAVADDGFEAHDFIIVDPFFDGAVEKLGKI